MLKKSKFRAVAALIAMSVIGSSSAVMAYPATVPDDCYTINFGETCDVYVDDWDATKFISFTPEYSGCYRVYSTHETTSVFNPGVTITRDPDLLLHDPSLTDPIEYTADGDFGFFYTFTAGETYYFEVTDERLNVDLEESTFAVHLMWSAVPECEGATETAMTGAQGMLVTTSGGFITLRASVMNIQNIRYSYRWLHNGAPVLDENGEEMYVNMSEIEISDTAGTYTCIVQDQGYEESRVSFTLRYIEEQPTVYDLALTDTSTDYIMVRSGQQFSLDYEYTVNDPAGVPGSSVSYILGASASDRNAAASSGALNSSSSAITVNGISNFNVLRYALRLNAETSNKYVFAFALGNSPDAALVPGQTVHIDVNNGVEGLSQIRDNTTRDFRFQYIYSYTPSESGTAVITLDRVSKGVPQVALFDSDLNLVSYAGGQAYFADRSSAITLSANLQANRTYYFAVPLFYEGAPRALGFEDRTSATYDLTLAFTPDAAPGGNTPAPVTDTPTPAPSTPAPTTPAATPSASSGYSVGDFVERLYTVALGRSSDPAGKDAWIAAVTERGETGADLARGFLYSDEFLNKDVSNSEFVSVLYNTFFNRAPDAAGLEGWVAALDGGQSKQDVIEGFINSTEWSNLCLLYGIVSGGTGTPSIEVEPNQATIDFATRLYTTCLNRNADQNGLMAWARQLANQRDTGTGAARGFFFSSEFINQNVSNEEYVNRLYRTFMGREADEAGFNAWVGQLNEGVSREEVFDGFAQSTEFGRICASYGIIR